MAVAACLSIKRNSLSILQYWSILHQWSLRSHKKGASGTVAPLFFWMKGG
ncbi:hypothetical protein B296_00050537 [Ensete ventricosum]|uniref:Uncharacterized protein n=1 Tax=Ensete ventricosum TaxID=4639 RepID=A0A426X639_ENSVE|nr:hypothetical protein B296_00050537 [Ensete ventricosum]